MKALQTLLEWVPWQQKHPLLSAAGVTTILTDANISVDGIQHIATIPNQSNVEFHLYKDRTALGQAQFVTSWEYADSDNSAGQAMLHQEFDPRQHVVLQTKDAWLGSLWTDQNNNTDTPPLPEEAESCPMTANISDIHTTPSSISLSLSASCDGYVVFPHPFYPGWHGTIDGKKTPILRANLAFTAIFVPQGSHAIKLVYAPTSVIVGAMVSLLFIGILAISIAGKREIINRLLNTKKKQEAQI